MSDKTNAFNFESSIDIDRLARLCRLEISDSDRAVATSELKKMADYTYPRVKCDTEVEPFAYDRSSTLPREDIAVQTDRDTRDAILANSPSSRDGYVSVPKIITEEK